MCVSCVLLEVKHVHQVSKIKLVVFVSPCRWQILIEFCAGGAVDAVMLGESAAPLFITSYFTNRKAAGTDQTSSRSEKAISGPPTGSIVLLASCTALITV